MFSKEIKFYSPFAGAVKEPTPALRHIPEYYKKLKSHMNQSNKSVTVKKCIPFLDALTSGYIIPFPVDIQFVYDFEEEKVKWELSTVISDTAIARDLWPSAHDNIQMPNELRFPNRTVEAVFKFSNIWKIKTPPGYSCIFTQPFNRVSSFKIIDGIVDTDTFDTQINFPFYWTGAIDKPTLLKEGTPMVQVIPFKREKWKMNIEREDFNPVEEDLNMIKRQSKIFDNYKTKYWNKKEYK